MKSFLLCLLLNQISESSGERFGQFRITQGELKTAGLRCILKSRNDIHDVAFRVRGTDGECELLTNSWLSNRTYHPGYQYIENDLVVFQNFSPPNDIGEPNPFEPDEERMWTIPGRFGVGGRMELYITTPFKNWNKLIFRIFDKPAGSSFDVSDTFEGLLLVSVALYRSSESVFFKSFSKTTNWYSTPTWTPVTFEDGCTYKISIEAKEQGFRILFDGIERSIIPYLGPPETAKTLVIDFGLTRQTIENITFYGV